ncbi:hypothetical protein KG088_14325 [Halomonas sp. TRM85114]|uniref:hypothetical protein n=1 Tax=Halomonas jincaotanensis TaxID=2810616 RepID=UPI001BD34CAB|nr:hypothetical protein [Halomonas jincaotanensis]MBS9404811.1 hypothetical protein [Halomonas jincaotanensis]
MSTRKKSKANQALTSFFHFRPESWDASLHQDSYFSSLMEKEQRGLASFMWAMFANAIPHKSHRPDLTPIHWRAKQDIFVSAARFDEINDKLGWFDKELEGVKGRYASGWELTSHGREVASGFFSEFMSNLATKNNKLITGMIDAAGAPYRTPSDAFRSITATGSKCRFPRSVMSSLVEINTQNLQHLIEAAECWLNGDLFSARLGWLKKHWDEYERCYGHHKADGRVRMARDQAKVMLVISLQCKGEGMFVPTIYSESKAGRLYAMGHVNLQRCVGEVRRLALQGCYDVDIENCHWSLLSQMAMRIGIDTPNISYYLDNKKLLRNQIAGFAGITIDDAKFVLISLIYGAVLRCRGSRESFDDKKNAIEAELGRDVVERLATHPMLQGLLEDLRKASCVVVEYYTKQTKKKGGVVVNDAGREISISKSEPKILSHILQGAESEALRVMIEELKGNLVLLQHDGVTVKFMPDLVELEKRVKEKTGFSLSLEADLL